MRYDIILGGKEYKIYGNRHTIDRDNKIFTIYNDDKLVTYIAYDHMIITIRDEEYILNEARMYLEDSERRLNRINRMMDARNPKFFNNLFKLFKK